MVNEDDIEKDNGKVKDNDIEEVNEEDKGKVNDMLNKLDMMKILLI
jgi:hypothetical protein